jgi:hypothetical protein
MLLELERRVPQTGGGCGTVRHSGRDDLDQGVGDVLGVGSGQPLEQRRGGAAPQNSGSPPVLALGNGVTSMGQREAPHRGQIADQSLARQCSDRCRSHRLGLAVPLGWPRTGRGTPLLSTTSPTRSGRVSS